MDPNKPIHSDGHRVSILQWINGFLAIAVIVVGVILRDFIIPVLGLGLASVAWFTTTRGYDLYDDKLVVTYGKPRRTEVPLSAIRGVELLSLPVGGDRLFVRRDSGRDLVLSPKNVHEFLAQLEQALEKLPL